MLPWNDFVQAVVSGACLLSQALPDPKVVSVAVS